MNALPFGDEGRGAARRLSRRDILNLFTKGLLTVGGLLGLGGVARFLAYQPDPPEPTTFDLGPASGYPPGSQTPLPHARAFLLHASNGFAALSTTCPHLGCQVESTANGFACPCHGSRFDRTGALLKGPAARPLTVLRLAETEDGRLILHTD